MSCPGSPRQPDSMAHEEHEGLNQRRAGGFALEHRQPGGLR